MDIFNTVASAIDLTERVWKAIDDFHKVPERMRRLQFDVKNLSEVMRKLKDIHYRNQEQEELIEREIKEIEATLKVLQNKINRSKQKPNSSALSRGFGRFKTQLKFDDMDEIAKELQKRKISLNLTINMLVLNTVGQVEKQMDEQRQETTTTAKAATTSEKPGTDPRKAMKKGATHVSKKDFLDNLNAPTYAEDELRVKVPAEGTAKWIYERDEYKKWIQDETSSSLHLVGKMGSGKSVLIKSLLTSLRLAQSEEESEKSAVLYYFCSCVNRMDNPENILKGFISQLVLEHEHIYENVAGSSELLQSKRTGENTSWSFEALWHIFSKMVQSSGLKSLFCVVDALDECASQSLNDFLDLLHKLSRTESETGIKMKLLFSSRQYTHILDSLDSCGPILRLSIDPDLVASDIRIAMQGDIKNIQRRLKLEEDELGTLQESILQKSDGMFLWVSLAAKDIMDNAYDATFETLEELIEDLPSGLKGLYEKNWVKLIESLPNAKLALAKKVLTWVLLAKRPLTISELTMALAIEPGQKQVPPPKRLLRNLSAFVLNYLPSFIEIISNTPDTEKPEKGDTTSNDPPPIIPTPSFKPKDNTIIRLVHQSAQEYLLEACNVLGSQFEIDLRDGHETIARTCLTYMQCKELQLGWIHPIENGKGLYVTTDETRSMVETRLNEFTFLGYSSVNWPWHIRKCQYLPKSVDEKEEDDVFQQAINFVQDFPDGYACSAQARQLLNHWEGESHYPPAPPLHGFAGKDMLTIVQRLLKTPEKYVHSRDLEQCTALHYPAQGDLSKEHPEERDEIVHALLEAGVDPEISNILGDTPLSDAAAYPLPQVVKILLERGVSVNKKNKDGRTALNQNNALGSIEIVEYLLNHGADIDSTDNEGFTPIQNAAGSGHWDTVKLLIARKCNVNAQCDLGWAPLHYAAEKGEAAIVRLLIETGADVHVRTKSGFTPLHSAVRFDRMEVFQLLLKLGADVHVKDNDGRSILHSAAEGASFQLFKLVFESVKGVNAKAWNDWNCLGYAARRDHLEIAKFLVENGADVKATESTGFTALHLAVESTCLKVARYLIDLMDDISIPTSTGITCLSLASSIYRPKISPELIESLIEKGADPNLSLEENGMTPLHIACCEGAMVAVELLLKHGADIEKPADFGIRPLCFACKEGKLDVAKYLHSKGALLDCGRSTGTTDFTPLELTVFNGHLEVVRWLLEQGADAALVTFSPVIRDNKMSPRHNDIFRLMMAHGCDVDTPENGTDTPLHCALGVGNTDFAKLVLEYKPNVTTPDLRGNTAYHLAVYEDDESFWKLLDSHSDSNRWPFCINYTGHTPAQRATLYSRVNVMKTLVKFCPKETFHISTVRNFWILLKSFQIREKFELLDEMGAIQIKLADLQVLPGIDFIHTTEWLQYKFVHSVDILKKLNFNWNVRDAVGRPLIHFATGLTLPSVVKCLLKLGARVDVRDFNFMTPIDLLLNQIAERLVPAPREPRPPPSLPLDFVSQPRLPLPPLPPLSSDTFTKTSDFPYLAPLPAFESGLKRNDHPTSTLVDCTEVDAHQIEKNTGDKKPVSNKGIKRSGVEIESPDKDISAITTEVRAPLSDTTLESKEASDDTEQSPSAGESTEGFVKNIKKEPTSSPNVKDEPLGQDSSSVTEADTKKLSQTSSRTSSGSGTASIDDDLPLYYFPTLREMRVKLLIDNFFTSAEDAVLLDDRGATLLHTAVQHGIREVIEPLLKSESGQRAVKIEDKCGWTAGMMAERCGNSAIASLFSSIDAEDFREKENSGKDTERPTRLCSSFKGRDLTLSEDGTVVDMADFNCGIRREISPEGFKIQITNRANAVMANAPVPYQDETFYFEVELLADPDETGGCAIGFATLTQDFNFHLPGWTRGTNCPDPKSSWGYHAVNGFRCPGDLAFSEPYGCSWRIGDRVGCGYDVKAGNIWFTNNGEYQGMAYTGVRGILYPIVGLAGSGTKMKIDFNVTPPPIEERVEPIRPAPVSLAIPPPKPASYTMLPFFGKGLQSDADPIVRDRKVEEVDDIFRLWDDDIR